MSRSIMSMADDILKGALTEPAKNIAPIHQEEDPLPELSDEQREAMLSESLSVDAVDEKLGPELKKHAKQGETSYAPGHKEKHTSVNVSSDDRAKLSPGAKAKLKSHDQRSGSRQDQRTSWAVDRQQSHQKAKWSRESDRQRRHTASRGKPTKGAKPEAGSTTDAWSGQNKPNTSTDTIQTRKTKLSQANRDKMADKAPAHQARRRASAEEKRRSDRERWKRTNPSMKKARMKRAGELRKQRAAHASGEGPKPKPTYNPAHAARRKAEQSAQKAGVTNMDMKTMTLIEKKPSDGLSKAKKKKVAKKARKGEDIGKKGKNFDKVADKAAEEYGSKEAGEKVAAAAMWKNMKKEHIEVLIKARDILREVTTVGGIGMKGMGGSSNRAYHQNRAQNKTAWTPETPVAPVDKSLRKVSKGTAKKVLKKRLKSGKKNETTKDALDRFLDVVLSAAQRGTK